MADMLLTIQHNETVFAPPVKEGVKIEWERTGTPGKLSFTTVGISSGEFTEGDPVCFYYDDKPVFMGYVFIKKHDREGNIDVTCYDQLRYLKNKFTYVFENKTASQIIQALCKDFNLEVGGIDDTKYVIPAVAEENKSALDIVLTVLEETLTNTGDLFVLYDEFGKLRVRNIANMVSDTLICEDTAEKFDYKSSIDDETYNQIVLYYQKDGEIAQLYTTYSPSTTKQWGALRYFEEVKNPSIGQNKANALLKLYNKKTREFKVTGAFGDITVRAGTLIPIKMELGDISVSNYMVVEKITHNFNNNLHTMDLTLAGAWEDVKYDGVSKTYGELTTETNFDGDYQSDKTEHRLVEKYVNVVAYSSQNGGIIDVSYYHMGEKKYATFEQSANMSILCDENSLFVVNITPRRSYDYNSKKVNGIPTKKREYKYQVNCTTGSWTKASDYSYNTYVTKNSAIVITWLSSYKLVDA